MGEEALKSEDDAAVVMVDEAEARMTCTHTHTHKPVHAKVLPIYFVAFHHNKNKLYR